MPHAYTAAAVSSAPSAPSSPAAAGPRRRLVLATVAGAAVLVNLDLSAVNVALDSIQDDLSLTVGETAWILNGYSLAFACLIAVAGRGGDTWGRRRVFVGGACVFVVASAFDALASDGWWLIAARIVQGGGAAFMFPAMLAIAAVTFPGSERAVAVGTIIAVASASQGLGPLIGGALTEFADWRLIFWVNVPVGVGVIAAALRFVPESRDEDAAPVGWSDAAVVTAGLVAVSVALDQGSAWGWSSPATWGLALLGALLLAAFAVLEHRVARPLVGPELLRNRDFQACNVAGALLYFVFFPVLMYVALFLQEVLGFSAFEAGAGLLPLVGVSALLSRPVARLAVRTGPTLPMTTGFVVFAAGAVAFAWVADLDATYVDLVVPLVLCGLGIGLAVSLNASTAVGSVDPARAGAASGVNFAVRLVGGVVGLALVTSVFEAEGAGGGDGGQPFVDAFGMSMLVLAGASVLGAVINQLWVRDPDRPSP